MSVRSLYNFCQAVGRPAVRSLLKSTKTSKLILARHLQESGARAGFTSALAPDVNQVSITKTFPTSHQSLKVGFQDNLASDFQYIWLRDNCRCSKCIHSESKQKMVDTVSLDINIKPSSYNITENGELLKIQWPDGHLSSYNAEWLHKYGKGFELESYDNVHDSLPPMTLWNGEAITKIKPEVCYKEVMETEPGLEKWLTMLYKYGIAVMKGVPCKKGEVVNVMERTAYVKKTKWGQSFDVICEPVQNDPTHLAYTGMFLELHTDMNYLESSPGLQALHCLKANSETEEDNIGGQSFFVDGFYVAKWLRKEHPSAWHVLTSTPIEFKILSHNMEYSNQQYVICATNNGDVKEVHYNTRTMAPMKGPADSIQPFYGAYKLMGQKMRQKECEFAFNLVPGDLVAFNNRRILHGRTSFDPRRMSRHLEGCYGDIDEIITRCKAFLRRDS